MTVTSALLDRLHQLIGSYGYFQDTQYELVEVLESQPAIVLHDCSQAREIQADMHGEAHRLVDKTHTVNLLNEAHDSLHPVLKEFFHPDIQAELKTLAGLR